MDKLSYAEFHKHFTCERELSSEFSCNQTTISIGIYKGRRVALKMDRDMKLEFDIHRKIGYHPNIVQLIGEVYDDEYSYILMEGIKDGLTLCKYCEWSPHQVALPIPVCKSLMIQLASALCFIHEKGIIHHDLKMKNILVDLSEDEIKLKICDFGISEIVDEHGHGQAETREYGTYANMAPEQFSGEYPITNKIDVYAFGGICNGILLKGRDIDTVLKTAPVELLCMLRLCHNKDPDQRPSMRQVLEYLTK